MRLVISGATLTIPNGPLDKYNEASIPVFRISAFQSITTKSSQSFCWIIPFGLAMYCMIPFAFIEALPSSFRSAKIVILIMFGE